MSPEGTHRYNPPAPNSIEPTTAVITIGREKHLGFVLGTLMLERPLADEIKVLRFADETGKAHEVLQTECTFTTEVRVVSTHLNRLWIK